MRLDKFLCKSTEFTKSEAIQCIHAGDVLVNGKLAVDEAMQVHENNVVLLNGVKLVSRALRYLLLHKPANTVCSNIDEAYPSVFHCLDIDKVSELHIAGRLDADTTGLVLITDDGHWSFHITSPKNACRKVYRVGLSRAICSNAAADISEKFAKGIQLQGDDKLTLPAELEILAPKEALLTITEGRFHQVKRMFAAVGNRVVSLHREQIGDVCLDVEVGQWRYLTQAEITSLGKVYSKTH